MKRLLRLYPTSWRARYEAEVADLLDQLPTDRSLVLDLIRAACAERALFATRLISDQPLPEGGPSLLRYPLQRHQRSLALLALAIVLPTTAIVTLSVLAYELGVTGLQPALAPVLVALPSFELVNIFVIVAPALGLAVALLPQVGIGVSRPGEGLVLTVALEPRGLNLVVIVLCMAVGMIGAWHHVVEVMLETGL